MMSPAIAANTSTIPQTRDFLRELKAKRIGYHGSEEHGAGYAACLRCAIHTPKTGDPLYIPTTPCSVRPQIFTTPFTLVPGTSPSQDTRPAVALYGRPGLTRRRGKGPGQSERISHRCVPLRWVSSATTVAPRTPGNTCIRCHKRCPAMSPIALTNVALKIK